MACFPLPPREVATKAGTIDQSLEGAGNIEQSLERAGTIDKSPEGAGTIDQSLERAILALGKHTLLLAGFVG